MLSPLLTHCTERRDRVLRASCAAGQRRDRPVSIAYRNRRVNPAPAARRSNVGSPPQQGAGPTFDRLAGLDPVVGEQQRAELARSRPGLPIALGGGHDAALHEDVPLAREAVDALHAGLLRPGRR